MVDVLSRCSRLDRNLLNRIQTNSVTDRCEATDDRPDIEVPTHRARRLGPERVAKIVKEYGAGEQIKVLADRYGVHRATVIAHLRRQGVPRRSEWSEDVISTAVRMYESGSSLATIADHLGLGRTAVGTHLRAAGVELRPRGWQ